MNANEMKTYLKCPIRMDPQVIIERQREEIRELRAKLKRYENLMSELEQIANEHETPKIKKKKLSIFIEYS